MKEKRNFFSDILLGSHNIDVSKYDDSFLIKSLQKRITETHCSSTEDYFNCVEQNKSEGDVLFNSLHISYSEIFRNPLTFSVLESIILPSLILKKKNTTRKEIRIWSAACVSGQEVYSLAMLMEELKSGDNDKPNYRIFATDLNESQINEARAGKYPDLALNNLNLKRVKQWFNKLGETYTIKPELKFNIDFSVFDLFDEQLICPPESIFGDFDLVFCSNLLFYYKEEYRKLILEKIGKCMKSGGYLVTGEVERDILLRHNYREVFPQSAIFQKM